MLVTVIVTDILLTPSQDSVSKRTANFFKFLLYATAVLSLIRFFGFLWFLGKTGLMCCFARR